MNMLESIQTSVRNLIAPLLNKKTLIVLGVILFMRGVVTGVMIYMENGFTSTFLTDWLDLLVKMVFIMMPVAIMSLKLINELFKKLMPNVGENIRTVLLVMIMVFSMESYMTFNTAMDSVGLVDTSEFITTWMQGLLTALPVSIATMLIMALAVKPRIKAFLGIDTQRTA